MTKIKTLLLTTAALAAAGVAIAAPKADTNNDGQVTQAEFITAAALRFDATDTNADDVLTEVERKAAHEARRANRPERGEKAAKRDINGDGVINEADTEAFKAKRAERKAQREASGESKGRKGRKAGKRGANPDANGDGVITRAEFDAGTLAMFERLDANSDGVLTKGEGRRGKKGKRGKKDAR